MEQENAADVTWPSGNMQFFKQIVFQQSVISEERLHRYPVIYSFIFGWH